MSNIYNFGDYSNEIETNTNVDIDNSPMWNQFKEILDTPDDIFDEIFPYLKEEAIKASKSKDYEKLLAYSFPKNISEESVLEDIDKCKDYINNSDICKVNLSNAKREFITFLLDLTADAIKEVPYREKVEIFVEKCHENAVIPTYANPTDAGCDVYAIEDTVIFAGETKIIPTGLKVAVPGGWMLSVRPRSGMSAKTNIRVANAPGTIDAGYRNEVGIILQNTGKSDYTIKKGERIAQFIVEVSPMIKFTPIEDINSIGGDRGGGFGSTGK